MLARCVSFAFVDFSSGANQLAKNLRAASVSDVADRSNRDQT